MKPTPEVYYVAKVAPSQRESAMADAFAEAKAHATEMATGVGLQRGPLVELAPLTPFLTPCDSPCAGIGDTETSATDPNSCYLRVSVTARFRLLEKDK